MPPLATLRYGAARAAGCLPEGPPQPTQDPKGGTGATPRHPALRRYYGAARAPGGLPEGPPPPPTSDPAPPEIGRGSKWALTHRAGKSNRLM